MKTCPAVLLAKRHLTHYIVRLQPHPAGLAARPRVPVRKIGACRSMGPWTPVTSNPLLIKSPTEWYVPATCLRLVTLNFSVWYSGLLLHNPGDVLTARLAWDTWCLVSQYWHFVYSIYFFTQNTLCAREAWFTNKVKFHLAFDVRVQLWRQMDCCWPLEVTSNWLALTNAYLVWYGSVYSALCACVERLIMCAVQSPVTVRPSSWAFKVICLRSTLIVVCARTAFFVSAPVSMSKRSLL